MLEAITSYLLHNFTLTLLVMGFVASAVSVVSRPSIKSKNRIVEALVSWFIFFSIGISYLYNGIVHTVFAKETAKFIGWSNSPFQMEVGFASFGFALIGFLAFKGSWQTRLCAILGPSCFLLGAAGTHIYQVMMTGNVAPGNVGVVLYTDIFLPIIGWIMLYLSRPSKKLAEQ